MKIFNPILQEANGNKHKKRNHTLYDQQKEMYKKLKKNGLMREQVFLKRRHEQVLIALAKNQG
jgi:hypothetical protein